MPRDLLETETHDLTTGRGKLLYLAQFIEREVPEDKLRMERVHSDCGSAHCAYGWGHEIGLIPRKHRLYDEWLAAIRDRRQTLFGTTVEQHFRCFDGGDQFRHLGRPYTKADVVAMLRTVADELEPA